MVHGAINMLGAGQTHPGQDFPGKTSYTQVVNRKIHPWQAEDYWGHVNPIGQRSCYDERQALRGNAIF